MTHETEFDPTARLLADVLNTDPPPDVETRLRERLDLLRTRMESPTVGLAKRRFQSRWWFAVLASASAAAVLLAIVLLPIGSSSALGQIVEAVALKTWLHGSGTGPDGQPAEIWFSAQKGVVGFRSGETYVFVDQIQGTMDVFGKPAAADSVQRMPLEYVPSQGIEAARHSLLALLGGELQQAMKSGDNKVLEHSAKAMRVDGRELIEHRFVVGDQRRDGLRSMSLLQVDPQTDLPISWQMKHGDKLLFDFKVAYPDHGPLTIVALGAPETAKIVDLAPQGEFKQALLATTAARRRFDDYHAVVVQSMRKSDRATAGDLVYRVWRKGDLWRVDQCLSNFDAAEIPKADDPKTWWLQQARSARSFPREIWDGQRLSFFEPEYATPVQPDPANPRFRLIDSLKTTIRPVMDRHDPQSYGFMLSLPELYGYEHLSRGASFPFKTKTRPVELDRLPMTLVEIINTSSQSPNAINRDQYWLDPHRGHLMVRKEQFRVSQPDQPVGVSEVVSAARTPQGLWYPTVVRLIGNTVSLEDNSRSDSYVRYYLEFDSDIPDELFRAKSVDAKNFWTESE